MVLLVDANALFFHADAASPHHAAVVSLFDAETGSLVTSQAVAAEADYLIDRRLDTNAELAFLADLADGALVAECLSAGELRTAWEVAHRYRDLALGLADASLVVLAARYRTRRVATFDERCFRTVAPLQGGSFTVLPADG
ncbi:MAG: PIN domain-containing protein [Actinomycetota bacterium]|jgi:predicted nucleic acid-binding protein|nr:PIN domain-containing protein [Euzebyaceae bacterium]MDQ3453454.1 PIN domain-containing protein [Actinomycetota bacterium]